MSKRVAAPEQAEEIPTNPEDRSPDFIWVDLSKPVVGFDGEITTLKLRKPTGADIIRVGNPIQFDPISDPPKISFDYPVLSKMIARLGNIASISVEQMDPADLVGIGWTIAPNFLPRPGTV